MPRPPDDGHHGDGGGPRPFWARARIDGTALDVVTTLVRALAAHSTAGGLADPFAHCVAVAAAILLAGGAGTFDLWEEPGRLVCHVARGDAPGATAPRPDPRRLRLVPRTATPGGPGPGIVVELGPGRVTVVLLVPFG
ncbi:hypothetical protein [Pseudonocardia alni]|uniref:Uncharacterized protein n=1 Tax=Pseudonocardia alni TaxID=33907 RepID=A0AA44ZR02_PSEA5|nr:hypothetical protein [Pseudonocardia alni]PKB32334.1 hypothetical protein ATL51_4058 [Pseudonocardia alni]